MLITKPEIEGWAEGLNVVGDVDGVVEGAKVGEEVINMGCDRTSQLLSIADSNTSIEASTSSVFVVSTIRFTCALIPYSGTIITSKVKHRNLLMTYAENLSKFDLFTKIFLHKTSKHS